MKIKTIQEKLNNIINEIIEQEGDLDLKSINVSKDIDNVFNIRVLIHKDEETLGFAVYLDNTEIF